MIWTLFVEGDWDQVFIKWLLQHLNISCVEITMIGGGISKLEIVKNQFYERYNVGRRIAVLLTMCKVGMKNWKH